MFHSINETLANTAKRTVMWENPDSTVAFAAQEIAMDLSDADEVEIYFIYHHASATGYVSEVLRCEYVAGSMALLSKGLVLSSSTYQIFTRAVALYDDKIVFGNAIYAQNTNNQALRPTKIVKIKY